MELDDVCEISSGGTPSKNRIEYWNNGTIKWLGSAVCQNVNEIHEITNYITEEGLNNSSAKLLRPGTTLIAMVGTTIGKVAYLTFESTTNQNIAALYPIDSNILNNKYLYYTSQTLYRNFLELTNGGFGMASLSFIRKLVVPIPSLEEQERIVSILDKFDKYCNDILEGLPAEIKYRQQQYEYYRDRLLNFKRID